MATVAKYFSGTQPVKDVFYMGNREFHDKFPGVVGRRVDGYSKFVGHPIEGADQLLALIAGTKTLTNTALAYAERMGFQINNVGMVQS